MAKDNIKYQKSNIKNKEETKKIKSASKTPSLNSKLSGKSLPRKDSGQAQTMEELLAATGYKLKGLKKGDVVEGTITRLSRSEVTIDIGGKTDGVLIDKELETYKDLLATLSPGDRVTALVIVAENDRGQSVLSIRRHLLEKQWAKLAEYIKTGEPVEVVVKEPVRGGVLVDYGGIRGYIPLSQLEMTLGKQLDRATGRRIQVKVIEVDHDTNRLVFSQRAILEGEALIKQKELLDAVPVDETVEAEITGIVPFGAFAKFTIEKDGQTQAVEGLIHISEIAWEKVEGPNQYLKVGDEIKVKIIGADRETGKITLSIKQLLPDPWEHVLDMFEKDSEVKGTVSRVTPIGIFVTLSPGVEGLVHISKLIPGQEPKEGEEISCIVEDVKPEARKISLSMTLKEKPIGYR